MNIHIGPASFNFVKFMQMFSSFIHSNYLIKLIQYGVSEKYYRSILYNQQTKKFLNEAE